MGVNLRIVQPDRRLVIEIERKNSVNGGGTPEKPDISIRLTMLKLQPAPTAAGSGFSLQ